jgi:hypothetical protein
MVDPDDRRRRRRRIFPYAGKESRVRLCMPIVATKRVNGETQYHLPYSPWELWREHLLQEIGEKEGSPPDLKLTQTTRRYFSVGGVPLEKTGHVWHLQRRPVISIGGEELWWNQQVMSLCIKSERAHELSRLIARAFLPATHEFGSDQYDYLVYVPVDLRDSVDIQLNRHGEMLSEFRKWMYRLVTGKTPARPRAHQLWRDTYIYLLTHVEKWRPYRVANAVFPESKRGLLLVEQALSRVDRALEKSSPLK